MFDEQLETRLHDLFTELLSASAWTAKEDCLQRLAPLIEQHPFELQEALLLAGPTAVLDTLFAITVSQRVQLSSKLLAADVLSALCTNCSRACLLLCPSSLVERLMRCAYKGDADLKAAAARALWQLSCHNDFSPEVVSHAGNAFKVVDLLAEDMQQASSSTCMCALRATQNLLQAYITHGTGDAGDRIGARIIEPLCNLLEAKHPEAATAAAELLALLGQSAPNRARIVAAGGLQQLVALMRQTSSNCTSMAANSTAGEADPPQQQAAVQQQEAAAAQVLHALSQLSRGDSKLCMELLSAHVMPALLQLLHLPGCSAGALGLMGDLVTLPEGRRALQYAEGLTALADAVEGCPAPLVCRLLSKATKGSPLLSDDLAAIAGSPPLLAVLVECCGVTDRKTRKRAMQVLSRLCEHSRATGKIHHLQSLLLSQGLLQQTQTALHSLLPQRPVAAAGSSSSSGGSSNVLELQLVLNLLFEVSTSAQILHDQDSRTVMTGDSSGARSTPPASAKQGYSTSESQQQQQHKYVSGLSSALSDSSTAAAAYLPDLASVEAVMSDPATIWQQPAAAAAAFGDMSMLPGLDSNLSSSSSRVASQHNVTGTSSPSHTACDQGGPVIGQILWLLLQLLLSQQHQLPSLQQQVLQVVCELAAHGQQQLLRLMVQQGWVQVLWSFLPGGRQLLAVTFTYLIQQKQQQQQQELAATTNTIKQPQQLAFASSPVMTGASIAAAAAATSSSKSSNLQPHLLQLLDESLPSVEQITYALRALTHLCSHAAAAAIVVQLQTGYSAAAASGMLSQQPTAHLLRHPSTDSSSNAAPVGTTTAASPAAAVVAMLFGGAASPRAAAAAAGKGPAAARGSNTVSVRSNSRPTSPGTLPSTPLSFASSSSSSSSGGSVAGSVCGSFVAVATPSTSSSLPNSGILGSVKISSSTDGGSSSSSAASGGSLARSSSSGLLSRLGIGKKDPSSGNKQKGQATAAAAAGDGRGSSGSSGKRSSSGAIHELAAAAAAGDLHGGPSAAAAEPIEDPGSPIEMLVTLLGEQWAATASAELLAHIAAAAPAICIPPMLLCGVIPTLAECMKEIQDNAAGAVAALAALLLVKQLSSHCPDRLHSSGVVQIVLHRLVQGFGDLKAVQHAALDAAVVLCQHGDRQLCAAVAHAALLPLVRWLGSSGQQAVAAAAVIVSLLDSGVIDGPVVTALHDNDKAAELFALCLRCSPCSSSSSSNPSKQQKSADSAQLQQQQQQTVQLTAVRLIRCLVEQDGRLVSAFLAADGLATLLSLLSAAVAADISSSSLSHTAAAAATADINASSSPPGALLHSEAHSRLILQYECLAILDSLSLVHRRVLVQAAIIPIIVGVLRQQQQQRADAPTAAIADSKLADQAAAAQSSPVPSSTAIAAADSNRMGSSTLTRTTSTASSSSRGLTRSSSRAPGAAAGLSALVMTPAELLLRCKVIACNLITVLAINNDVKRQLFHSDAVGPLMQLADLVEEGSSAQEAIRAALAQLGLVYLLPAGSAM